VAAEAGEPSPDSADQLIREIIDVPRPATDAEVQRIVERVASAPFNPTVVRVPGRERGATYAGHTLGTRESSLVYHLVKRVAIERQWAEGTTASDYLDDLRRAVRSAAARLALFADRGDHIVAVVTPTASVVPAHRRGTEWQPNVLVVYSADRGMIRTGYQFSSLQAVDIPTEAQWLR
jgi:hypothetical protein